MIVSRSVKIILVLGWIILSMCYYNYYGLARDENHFDLDQYYYNSNNIEDFLIYTPGCNIPNYIKTIRIVEATVIKKSCDHRAVFIKQYSDDHIQFIINEKTLSTYLSPKKSSLYDCCYKFAGPTLVSGKPNYNKLRYSRCVNFVNGTITKLEEEVVTVNCIHKSSKKTFYDDSYIILKPIKSNNIKHNTHWNILLIGMDTMSRARLSSSMPKTLQYLKRDDWLDFKGYNKVDYNTFPNLASFLTGKRVSEIWRNCSSGMDICNKLFLWSDFQKLGYKTAYGEDFIQLPDTFTKFDGFKNKPTDHYMRPLFLTGENLMANLECTKKLTSARHILDYASNFSLTYKDNGFFGLFWINSYSHNLNNNPSMFEEDITNFFQNLYKSGVMNNTFIFFLSDHGIRYSEIRMQVESYYDERLPMLFLWVPKQFQQQYRASYDNLKVNQNMLISPYDLYVTMWDIHRYSVGDSTIMKTSEGCPSCKSLFTKMSIHRTCIDAGVDEKWCSCHKLNAVDHASPGAQNSVHLVAEYLTNISNAINTTACTKCVSLQTKKVHRIHTYYHGNRTYYVIAIIMSPENIAYETTVLEQKNTFKILQPTYPISKYNPKGGCVIKPNDRAYCVCKKIPKCKIKSG